MDGRSVGVTTDYSYHGRREAPYYGVVMNKIQKEIMLIAQEECAEVTQAISKCFRFGFDSEYNNRTNHERLTEEVGDLIAMIDLMIEHDIIDEASAQMAASQKKIKLKKWSNIFDEQIETVN